MNDNIIPYIPIADRVQATNPKSQLLCQQFFFMIDKLVNTQITFNHDTTQGYLSICPDQINDLIEELSKTDHSIDKLDIKILELALNDLTYPKYLGVHQVTSPIWNNTSVAVWQFQLNRIARDKNMQPYDNDFLLDQALATLRIWRQSLEAIGNDKLVTYNNNDLIYKLMDLEDKLEKVQEQLD